MGERFACPACRRYVSTSPLGFVRWHESVNGTECWTSRVTLAHVRRLLNPQKPARPTVLTMDGETSTYGLVEKSPWECWTPRPGWAVRTGIPEEETCPAPTPRAKP